MPEHVNRYHVIASTYDAKTKILHIRLAAGIYRYTGVPKELAERLSQTKDKDGLYLQEFKEKFNEDYIPVTTPGYDKIGL